MLYDHETFCLAAGMLLGAVYYHRTGWACGGIITPGIVAMYIADPMRLSMSMLVGVVTWLILAGLVRKCGFYGRQRLVAAMLIALTLRYPMVSVWGGASLWLGWVVPGLLGADIQKQGLVTTLSAVITIGVVAAMSVQLLQGLWGALG
jgi:gamma-polyglutamate biosynthesis protein CapC